MGDYEFLVCITSCERPVRLANLLSDLVREKVDHGASFAVRVYDDASKKDMSGVQRLCAEQRWMFIQQAPRHGKKRFSKIFTRLMSDCRNEHQATIIVVMPDDVRLCTNFFFRLRRQWDSIGDSKKRSLTLMVDRSRAGRGCWTGVAPQDAGGASIVQWMDGLFACTKKTFEDLDWEVPDQNPQRWQGLSAGLSSGVGAYMSKKLNSKGLKMYRVKQSLVVHVDGPSMMNPERRDRGEMVTVNFVDGEKAFQRLRRI